MCTSSQSSDPRPLVPGTPTPEPHACDSKRKLAAFAEAHDLFEKELAKLTKALDSGDLSLALFPRVGEEARIELTARQSQLQWVLEMLPNPNPA